MQLLQRDNRLVQGGGRGLRSQGLRPLGGWGLGGRFSAPRGRPFLHLTSPGIRQSCTSEERGAQCR